MRPATIHIFRIATIAFALALQAISVPPAGAQTSLGNGIPYSRANMKVNNALLNGTFDVRFKLFDAQADGNQIGPAITKTGVNVANGKLPQQVLAFGPGAFDGDARWIEVLARQGGAAFKLVGPRQRFLPVPYALALPGMYTIGNESAVPNIIGGYAGNIVPENFVGATISGGGGESVENVVLNAYGTVSGGRSNGAAGSFATVSGGQNNLANGSASAIGGGAGNIANGFHATVAGGAGNLAQNQTDFVGGGDLNTAQGSGSMVGGGAFNVASGFRSVVGGGNANVASGSTAAVAGGSNNQAIGVLSAIPGGDNNSANGTRSFAAGRRAKANHDGAFVWGDSTNADVSSLAANTFTARAVNGFVFYTNAALTTGAAIGAGAGSWTNLSDRNHKRDVTPINAREVLAKVVALPISWWSYDSQDPSIRHIGPMAQDFNAAFNVGDFETGITAVDADGVALAAIQGLNQIVLQQQELLQRKDDQISALNASILRLAQRLDKLEAVANTLNP